MFCNQTQRVRRIASPVMFLGSLQVPSLPTSYLLSQVTTPKLFFRQAILQRKVNQARITALHTLQINQNATPIELLNWKWPMRNDISHFPHSREELKKGKQSLARLPLDLVVIHPRLLCWSVDFTVHSTTRDSSFHSVPASRGWTGIPDQLDHKLNHFPPFFFLYFNFSLYIHFI